MSWPCPTCGRELDTQRGMRQHHTKVHGEALPNRTCKGCGTEFHDTDAKRDYCEDCNPNAGENNGNWKDAREMAECERCGQEFSYYPSDKEGLYCEDCVEATDEFLGTPYHEVHDIERVHRTCDCRDAEFTVLKSDLAVRTGRFCSHDCLCEWMSENQRGENHHQWLPGDSNYGGDWWQVRRAARDRDDHVCQHCGKSRAEMGREPDVHHITPVREFQDPQDAHDLDNVICLCRSCHRNAEEGDINVSRPTNEGR